MQPRFDGLTKDFSKGQISGAMWTTSEDHFGFDEPIWIKILDTVTLFG
jgi:hypothetical protein